MASTGNFPANEKNGVMPGLVPGIHVFLRCCIPKTWMAGTSSAKTRFALLPAMTDSKQNAPLGFESEGRVFY